MSRLNTSQKVPQEYDAGTFSKMFREIDAEVSRVSSMAGTVVWNPANILDGDNDSVAVTVPGVKVNTLASVRVFPPYTLSGLGVSGYVSADDRVTIVLNNNTGGAVNLASGTWGVVVENFVRQT